MHFQQAFGASAAGWGSHMEWKVLEEVMWDRISSTGGD